MDTVMTIVAGLSTLVAITAAIVAWRATSGERRRSAARIAALAAAADVATERVPRHDFAPVEADTPHGLLGAVAVAFVLIAGGGLALLVSGRAPAVATRGAAAPLELATLGHARPEGLLAISGRVHNPAAGRPVDQLEVHVRVFDAAGIPIATQSAPVDATSLPPGARASFTVTFGEVPAAARYRVSFASRGTMLAHVDTRTNLPAAVTADAR